ncbi:hypothetical protein HNY73_011211 [Argiope bruennichi]|uniref:Uncharacterized protein n=1 Tax=Argiope bruennichi TaxID=94029 RepID=A0A8T0F5V9_ARGBR|nr:hypothetical protein HNY73_011211 [Argiope bruennichi]
MNELDSFENYIPPEMKLMRKLFGDLLEQIPTAFLVYLSGTISSLASSNIMELGTKFIKTILRRCGQAESFKQVPTAEGASASESFPFVEFRECSAADELESVQTAFNEFLKTVRKY